MKEFKEGDRVLHVQSGWQGDVTREIDEVHVAVMFDVTRFTAGGATIIARDALQRVKVGVFVDPNDTGYLRQAEREPLGVRIRYRLLKLIDRLTRW